MTKFDLNDQDDYHYKRDQVTIVPIASFVGKLVLSVEINLSENLLGKGLERP